MNRLHTLLEKSINISADIENLRVVLKNMEKAQDLEERDLRAAVNLAILSLATLKKDMDGNIDVLDGYLLEQWHKNPSSLPKGI